MNLMRPTLAAALAGLGLWLAGCQAPAEQPSVSRQRDTTERQAWIERRAAQLSASGLSSSAASSKAAAEWTSRAGDPSESWTVYDSAAAQKAEQRKINQDLEKMQRRP